MEASLRRELDDHIYPRIANQETRITALEKWRERAIGVGIGVSLAGGIPSLVLGWMALTGKVGQ